MSDQVQALHQEALDALEQVNDQSTLQQWRSKYLVAVNDLFKQIGKLPKEERGEFGQRVNALKTQLTDIADQRADDIQQAAIAKDLEEGGIDITLPGRPLPTGKLHPSTQVLREFYKIWGDMGFQVFRSRDVEEDEVNFTLLNIPPHHPARDMQDTFYTDTEGVILRTHTSPGQIRAMRALGDNGNKPIRVILPGMCYRNEQITARSEIQFHQVEGLVIGRNIRMSDLKGTMVEFARRFYGQDTEVRFRASYFPFTEPSMEIDVSSDDMRLTKGTGWLEIGGSGMVHPNVLRNGGYDPTIWSGFAFGMGPERIIMNKRQIDDIRYFWSNDLRFLNQF